MIWFKTRHEVKQLRSELANFREMVRSHFDIKYDFQDFAQWCEDHPDSKEIPTSIGEFLRFYKNISPASRALYFRGMKLKPKSTKVSSRKEDK